MRKYVVIFKVNNEMLFNSLFDSDCNMGNGLYKMYLDGNKKSSKDTIAKRATRVVNRHKGLKIDIVDVMELA